MKYLALAVLVLKNLPAILRLIETIEAQMKEAETKRKISEDLNAIDEAFRAKDPEKLRTIFNS